MIVLIDIRWMVQVDWVFQGQTMLEEYYKNFTNMIREPIKKKRPHLWANQADFLSDQCPIPQGIVCHVVFDQERNPC